MYVITFSSKNRSDPTDRQHSSTSRQDRFPPPLSLRKLQLSVKTRQMITNHAGVNERYRTCETWRITPLDL